MSKKTYTVFIQVLNRSNNFVGERCYLASDRDRWQADGQFIGNIPAKNGRISYVLQDVEEGELEFKFTRGDWTTLNCGKDGKLLEPYRVQVTGDMEVEVHIDGWRDEFPKSTASPQVQMMADDFYFPNLDTHRRIWVYLPPDYMVSDRRYPVLYMHDGQHLFDEATAVGRAGPVEWMVDKTINLAEQKAIVIGIEHPAEVAEREREFLLHPLRNTTEPMGTDYLRDIVETLKPYVDGHYRTLADKRHTAMIGSSLGGLLTLYAGALYSDVFGILGVFSPSIWTGKEELSDFFSGKLQENPNLLCGQCYYFYAGGKEKRRSAAATDMDMRSDMLEFIDRHKKAMCAKILIDIDGEGKHGALYWQKAFQRFYNWWQKEIF